MWISQRMAMLLQLTFRHYNQIGSAQQGAVKPEWLQKRWSLQGIGICTYHDSQDDECLLKWGSIKNYGLTVVCWLPYAFCVYAEGVDVTPSGSQTCISSMKRRDHAERSDSAPPHSLGLGARSSSGTIDSGHLAVKAILKMGRFMLGINKLLAAIVVLSFIADSPGAQAQEGEALNAALSLQRAFQSVIEKGEKSVVSIARFKSSNDQRTATQLPPEDFVPNDFGTGMLITDGKPRREPVVLTNYHLVRGGPAADRPIDAGTSDILVRFHNRRRTRASIIAADPRSDLAVLKLELNGTGIKPADLIPFQVKPNELPQKGSLVVTLSNPYAQSRDGSASAGWGIVSNTARRFDRPTLAEGDPEALKQETIHHFGTLLQIDARLNLGSSGGALLNLKGEVIGITSSLAALDGYEKSAGFAIPFDKPTRRIIDSLLDGYEVEYGFLGVSPTTATEEFMRKISADLKQPTAARISKVVANSPAAVAGLFSRDIVLRVNGKKVFNHYDLMREVAVLGPDASAKLTVWREREGRERELSVRLGKWPVVDEEGIVATQTRVPPWRGIAVDYSTARWKHLPYQLDRYYQAVLVTGVAKESAAAGREAGLKAGDYITHVNQIPVTTPQEFAKVVSKLRGPVTLQLSDGRRVLVATE